MLSPTAARKALRRKAGRDPEMYYAIGVEVPPRQGSVFSIRYTTVPSARQGWKMLRGRMIRKRVGMVGELIIADLNSSHTISLGGFIRRENKRLEEFTGDLNRGALLRARGK